MNTKLHAICDSQGRPLNLFVTAGQVSDYIGARALLSSLPDVDWLLGDRGYDADWFRDALKDKGIRACIPGRKQRKASVKYDKRRYRRRNRIEIMFGIQDHAPQLAYGTLPANSLLRIHLGEHLPHGAVVEADPRLGRRGDDQVRMVAADDDEDADLNLDPDAPLVVSFQFDDRRPVISVARLGMVSGQPARVPHALRPALQEDRANGLPPAQHRFLHAADLPDIKEMSKQTFRQNVARCRQLLADNFELIHGHAPSRDLRKRCPAVTFREVSASARTSLS